MKTETMLNQVRGQVPDGETVLAAAKTMPRGAAHEVILGAAGAVAGGAIDPALAGAGSVLGGDAGAPTSEAGRQERAEAGLAVGSAAQVLVVVTDGSLLLFALNAFGRPKHLTARLERARIASVDEGEAALFGQKMLEIVVTTTNGAAVGFGVAKVHRRQGEAVLAALR